MYIVRYNTVVMGNDGKPYVSTNRLDWPKYILVIDSKNQNRNFHPQEHSLKFEIDKYVHMSIWVNKHSLEQSHACR